MSGPNIASVTHQRILRVRRATAQAALSELGLSKTRALLMTRAFQEYDDALESVSELREVVDQLDTGNIEEALVVRVYRLRSEHARLDKMAKMTTLLRSLQTDWAPSLRLVDVESFSAGRYRESLLKLKPRNFALIDKVTPLKVREAFDTTVENKTVRLMGNLWSRAEKIALDVAKATTRGRESTADLAERRKQKFVAAVASDRETRTLLEQVASSLSVQPWRSRYESLAAASEKMAAETAKAKRLQSFDTALSDGRRAFHKYFDTDAGIAVAETLKIDTGNELRAGMVLCEIANGTELRAFMVAETSTVGGMGMDI